MDAMPIRYHTIANYHTMMLLKYFIMRELVYEESQESCEFLVHTWSILEGQG